MIIDMVGCGGRDIQPIIGLLSQSHPNGSLYAGGFHDRNPVGAYWQGSVARYSAFFPKRECVIRDQAVSPMPISVTTSLYPLGMRC